MTASRTVAELAADANSFLMTGGRKSEDTGRLIIVRTDDAPAWVHDLCRAANDDSRFGPDDWRYEFIEDALQALEAGDVEARDLDSEYPYTTDRLRWLSSHLDRDVRRGR
jgi:hypothetical protein